MKMSSTGHKVFANWSSSGHQPVINRCEEKKRGSYWLQLGSGVGIDETAGSCRPLPAGSGIFATCMACTCRLLPALAGSCRLVVGHFQLVVLHRVFLHNLMSTGIWKNAGSCRLLLGHLQLVCCKNAGSCRLLPGVLQVVSVWSLDGLWVIY